MKRSEAIERLWAELMRWQAIQMTSSRGLEVYAIAAIDFLEKEIGMLPPPITKETYSNCCEKIIGSNLTIGSKYELKQVNEWE